MKPRRAGAARFRGLRHRLQEGNFRRVGGREHIAAAIEMEAVAGLTRQRLDQVDAAIHERGHRPVGTRPPVAIRLGRLVRGERQRIALLDDHDVVEPMPDRERVGGHNASNRRRR